MFAIFLHDNRELVVLCRLERPLLVSEEAGNCKRGAACLGRCLVLWPARRPLSELLPTVI